MELDDLQRNWNDLGGVDPLWAILAYPERKGGRWTPEEFFATGKAQVDEYLNVLDLLGVELPQRSRALDFGCGAGRLTQALSAHFAHADGVDIAESMVTLANTFTTTPEKVAFHLNEAADLRLFADDSFDYLISIVVLQHMNNELKSAYLTEFIRVLRPGGVAMFTVPSHADRTLNGLVRRLPNPIQNIYRRRRYGYRSVMEFHTMRRAKVEAAVVAAGGTVVAAQEEPMAGPPWKSYLYVVTKPEG
ncbi:MAG: class I SAM-dependent methyltransferase [Pedococcus sp.]